MKRGTAESALSISVQRTYLIDSSQSVWVISAMFLEQ